MRLKRLSLTAISDGWFAGPVLLVALLSPAAAAQSEKSLVVHHAVHWLMVVAGALVGYRLSRAVHFPGRGVIAWLGLGAALIWHLPPLLSWAETARVTHMFAHATLVAGGIALGWAVPGLRSSARGYLFIAANVVMWPLVLAEIAGAFSYPGYEGQAPAAGVVELIAMSASWLALAFWSSIRSFSGRNAVAIGAQAVVALVAIAAWLG